jgi:hypothetical protein
MTQTELQRLFSLTSDDVREAISIAIEQEYPEFWAANGMYIPMLPGLIKGTLSVEALRTQSIGRAEDKYPGQNTPVPILDQAVTVDNYPATVYNAMVRWDMYSATASKLGKDAVQERISILEAGMAEGAHLRALFGTQTMQGICNNTAISNFADSYDADGGSATAQTHINFFATQIQSMVSTAGVYPHTILVPDKFISLLATSYLANGTVSAYRALLDVYAPLGLRRIESKRELAGPVANSYAAAAGLSTTGAYDGTKDTILLLPAPTDTLAGGFYWNEPEYTNDLYHSTIEVMAQGGISTLIPKRPGRFARVTIPTIA